MKNYAEDSLPFFILYAFRLIRCFNFCIFKFLTSFRNWLDIRAQSVVMQKPLCIVFLILFSVFHALYSMKSILCIVLHASNYLHLFKALKKLPAITYLNNNQYQSSNNPYYCLRQPKEQLHIIYHHISCVYISFPKFQI